MPNKSPKSSPGPSPEDRTLPDRLRRHLPAWGDRAALTAPEGTLAYAALLEAAAEAAGALLEAAGTDDLAGRRVAFLAPPGLEYAAALLGIWRAGGLAVPLAVSHPPAELDYVLADSEAAVAMAGADFRDRLAPLAAARGVPLLATHWPERPERPGRRAAARLPEVEPERPALMLYTSGTTGRPKGVVTTHRALANQLAALSRAWGWTAADRALEVLPLHHTHGVVNVLLSALWNGAGCEILPRFDAGEVWHRLRTYRLTVFMAVPTIYTRLVRAWEEMPPEERRACSAAARGLRLMVSGSAALPAEVLARWREITGHTLLERYGMTEIGMALSNPLAPESGRLPGKVGRPLPGVEARLVDEAGEPVPAGEAGEIEIRSQWMFREYWRRPEETRAAFRDGWFRTGDVAVLEEDPGGHRSYRILGRTGTDILKTGGFKVSALEIEAVLRRHPAIEDCAVVGLPDPEWGERIAAAVVASAPLTLEELRAWARRHLAPYKLPARLLPVPELPRNALGKVVKPEVKDLFASSPNAAHSSFQL